MPREIVALTIGTQLGSHEITALLGKGGIAHQNLVLGKTTPLPIEGIVTGGPRGYDMMPDGKSFVVLQLQSQADPSKAPPDQINITLNWFSELQQRVPVK